MLLRKRAREWNRHGLLSERLLFDRAGGRGPAHRVHRGDRRLPRLFEGGRQRPVAAFREYLFPGVNPGDQWCLCAARWKQALEAGRAPRLYLERTHEKTLQYASLDQLLAHAVDRESALKAIAALDEMRRQLARTVSFDVDAGSQESEQ